MNHPLFPSLATLACLLLASCASTPQTRIERYPGMYTSLSTKHQQAVNEGRLVEGMNRDAVYLAWGRPAGIKEGSSAGQEIEKWRYTGLRPVYVRNVGFGYGYGYGRYCDPHYFGGTGVDYVPYTNAVVEFRNGKVIGWERERP